MAEIFKNIDEGEVNKFAEIAHTWWDKKGPFRGLHDINPVRVGYMKDRAGVEGKTILDIGCGGGILSEALAGEGGIVTGIDMNAPALAVARTHMTAGGLAIDYEKISAEEFAGSHVGNFDMVTCMELLEHVPRPPSLIRACRDLLKPGGHVFFATINKTVRSYILAIVMSEQVLRLMRKNTHDYQKFIKPAQLENWGKTAGLVFKDISGVFYFPYIPVCRLSRNTDVNYIMHFIRRD